MKPPKVALVHDYLVQNGGAEKTLKTITEIFQSAPIYTSFYKPENFPEFKNKKVITFSKISKIFTLFPILSKYFTFLVPIMFEQLDLRKYDIVISDSSSYSKGVLTNPNQLHVSYIHTPPRFLYGYSVENEKRNAWYYKPVVIIVERVLKVWDLAAAQRPDYLLANSKEIQKRIQKFYKRNSKVVYPPIELSKDAPSTKIGNYYLIVGRLAAYKNFDTVIKAFNQLPKLRLKVVGTGSHEKYLKKIAETNIEFLGRVTDEEKHSLMHNCIGLINSVKDEDFGIVPVEVQSHGKPVLAHKSAGHLETVMDGKTGMLYEKLTPEIIKKFDATVKNGTYKPEEIQKSVQHFSKNRFKIEFEDFINKKWKTHLEQQNPGGYHKPSGFFQKC